MYSEYITGRFIHEDHKQILRDIEWLHDKDLRYKKSFNEYSTQSCRDMVVYLR